MKKEEEKELYEKQLKLLKEIIETPSVTGEEQKVSDLLWKNLKENRYKPKKIGRNVLCYGLNYNRYKPNLLLNAHMDTVKPVAGWTKDPFKATIENGKLYGLGSNDDSAGLVNSRGGEEWCCRNEADRKQEEENQNGCGFDWRTYRYAACNCRERFIGT